MDWGLTIAIAVGAVLLIKAYVINPYRIPSASMEPTLHCARPGPACEAGYNDRVLANRFILHFRDPHRGDIVVLDPPPGVEQVCGAGGTYVKRIIGLPGETVGYENSQVFIDGSPLEEPYIEPGRQGGREGVWELGDDEYFMMGDNRQQSCDSRSWKDAGLPPVTRDNMIGPVFFVYWPPNRIGFR